MNNLIYNTVILSYSGAIHFAKLFSPKARLWVNGRKNWRKQLIEKRKLDDNWPWFHCASLGEYEDSCEIVLEIRKKQPQLKALLTFFSPSGYEQLKNSNDFDYVMYLPVDKASNVTDFLTILRPTVVLFSRSELWFNYTTEISKRNIPFFLISFRCSNNSRFLKWPATTIFKQCFSSFDHIFCQNKESQKLLADVFQLKNTSKTGNARFERVYKQSFAKKEMSKIAEFSSKHFTIVAGSVLPKDLKNILGLLDFFCSNNQIRLIIVPHEIIQVEIEKIILNNPKQILKYSDNPEIVNAHKIMIVDHVGSLKHIYKYADLAIIGGGFNKIGIHSIIEPAIYGLVSIFGPNHRNYPEALALLELKGALIYRNTEELKLFILEEVNNLKREKKKEEILNYVMKNISDSAITSNAILTSLAVSN